MAMQEENAGVPKEDAGKEAKSDGATRVPESRSKFQRILPWIVVLVAAGILLAVTGGWNRWVGGRATQKTDDAYLRADITPLSTKVSGTVQQVAVADYQRVKAGDLLVQ